MPEVLCTMVQGQLLFLPAHIHAFIFETGVSQYLWFCSSPSPFNHSKSFSSITHSSKINSQPFSTKKQILGNSFMTSFTAPGQEVMMILHITCILCLCVLCDTRKKQHCLVGLRNVDAVSSMMQERNCKIIFRLVAGINMNIQSVLPKGQ